MCCGSYSITFNLQRIGNPAPSIYLPVGTDRSNTAVCIVEHIQYMDVCVYRERACFCCQRYKNPNYIHVSDILNKTLPEQIYCCVSLEYHPIIQFPFRNTEVRYLWYCYLRTSALCLSVIASFVSKLFTPCCLIACLIFLALLLVFVD
jgi:hypothetical protein